MWASHHTPPLVFPALAWPHVYAGWDLPLSCFINLDDFSQDTEPGGLVAAVIPEVAGGVGYQGGTEGA